MKKKASHSWKKPGIRDDRHPFHAFAPKRQPPKKKAEAVASDRKPASARNRPSGKRAAGLQAHALPLKGRQPVATAIFPLNKYLSHTGLCARRKAVEYIRAGEVSVNGRAVTEPGFKVSEKDTIQFRGKKLFLQRQPVYILLNKPKGYITTTDDPQDRKTVMELVARAAKERVYPVGRLDRNTSGLLLLTNDGDLAQKLAHPSNNIRKIYHVTLDKPLTKHHFEKIITGMELEDGRAQVDVLAYEDENDKRQIGVEIHSGRNRIVRRIFESLGYEIRVLDRVMYAGLTKKNLPRGKWRMLTPGEAVLLKHFNKGGKNETRNARQ